MSAQRHFLLLMIVLATLLAQPAAMPADAQAGKAAGAPAGYRVVQLSAVPFSGGVDINAHGQVAFTERDGTSSRARLYDGRTVRDLGTLGGPNATAVALNDRGQVVGQSDLDRKGTLSHAYRWTPGIGMLDIDADARSGSAPADINEYGQVAGAGWTGVAGGLRYLGYFWSPQTGKIPVGSFGNASIPTALNDAGAVVGYAEGPEGGPRSILAFRWTLRGGIGDLGTMPAEFTWATDINGPGQVVGATPFAPDGATHAFVWNPRAGLRDLGIGSGERSSAVKINDAGAAIGYVITFGTLYHGFVWNRSLGFHEFAAGQAAITTDAFDLNRSGEVVGVYGGRAFLWTAAGGSVDLNTRLRNAPPGLVLTSAVAISDGGSIVATANSGLYLLFPQ